MLSIRKLIQHGCWARLNNFPTAYFISVLPLAQVWAKFIILNTRYKRKNRPKVRGEKWEKTDQCHHQSSFLPPSLSTQALLSSRHWAILTQGATNSASRITACRWVFKFGGFAYSPEKHLERHLKAYSVFSPLLSWPLCALCSSLEAGLSLSLPSAWSLFLLQRSEE